MPMPDAARCSCRGWALFVIIGIILTMTSWSAVARSDAGNRSINLGLVLEQVQLRDDLVRPFRFAGPAGGFSFGFAHVDSRGEHEAHLAAGLSYLTNRFGQESFAFRVRGSYRYLASLSQGSLPFHLSIGGAFRANMLPTYHANWDDAHLYWFTSYDIGPAAKVQWDALGPGSLSLSIELPLLALVSRPPRHRYNKQDELKSPGFWFAEPHSDLTLVTLPTYWAVSAGASYFLRSTGRWRFGGRYAFDLRSYEKPAYVSTLSHSFSLEAQRGW